MRQKETTLDKSCRDHIVSRSQNNYYFKESLTHYLLNILNYKRFLSNEDVEYDLDNNQRVYRLDLAVFEERNIMKSQDPDLTSLTDRYINIDPKIFDKVYLSSYSGNLSGIETLELELQILDVDEKNLTGLLRSIQI